MQRTALRVAISALLIGLGWTVGKAQTTQPDFELIVTAPAGETTVECRRGCELVWVERVNPAARRLSTFTFECSGGSVERCSSARIGGWVKREM
jgi:hypothetical protein